MDRFRGEYHDIGKLMILPIGIGIGAGVGAAIPSEVRGPLCAALLADCVRESA